MVAYVDYWKPVSIDERDPYIVLVQMLNNLTNQMSAHGDAIIELPDLFETFHNEVSIHIDNTIWPGALTYRALSSVLNNVANFLWVYEMKLTEFFILDSAHNYKQLAFGDLFSYANGAPLNETRIASIGGGGNGSTSLLAESKGR